MQRFNMLFKHEKRDETNVKSIVSSLFYALFSFCIHTNGQFVQQRE